MRIYLPDNRIDIVSTRIVSTAKCSPRFNWRIDAQSATFLNCRFETPNGWKMFSYTCTNSEDECATLT